MTPHKAWRGGAVLCTALVAVLWAWTAQAQVALSYAAEYNTKGIQAYEQGDYTEAIRYFEKAYELAADHGTVRHNLCNANMARANELAMDKQYQAAIDLLKVAISVEPENVAPLIQLGSYYLSIGDTNQAIFRLEEAIELKPGELAAHELLGEAYYRDNDIPSARAQWDYVLEVDPARKGLRDKYNKAFREESVEQDFKRSGSRHFRVSYPKEIPYSVKSRVLTVLERAYLDIGRKLGGVYPPAPIQVIIYERGQFEEATQLDSHIGAIYDGKIRTPLTTPSGDWLDDEELTRRLTHEYTHVVVRHLVGDNVPWWLNEGLAETFSKDVSSAEWRLLQEAQASRGLFQLPALEVHQLKKLDAQALRLAYAQSHATVNMLWSRFGQHRMVQFLDDLSEGMAPEEALRQHYRRSYTSLETEVAKSLRY